MRYVFFIGVLLVAACSADTTSSESTSTTVPSATTTTVESAYPPPPEIPDGPVDEELVAAIEAELDAVHTAGWDVSRVSEVLVEAGDPAQAGSLPI